ncbi:MAG TPA: hypothetical protein VLO30_08105 [Chthoniobacterales bacterium]|nr:hypothetical protein [Chthoniobacterales bacterium]
MKLDPRLVNLSTTPERQVALLVRLTAAAIGCSFLLSWKLWLSSRLFPLVPVSNYLPEISYPIDYIWFLLLLALLAVMCLLPRPRNIVLIFVCLAALLSLWDQMRWQPWFYQYLFMLAAMGILAWRKSEPSSNRAALNVCRLIVVATYFWSGIQKLNITFVRETWPDMASFLPGYWRQLARWVPSFLILAVPLVEVLIGFGLLWRRFRNRTVLLATATHVSILMLLSLTGENVVVWPWNAAMVLFVWILFWGDKETTGRTIMAGKNPFHILVLILFGILPSLSLVGLWDSYLSSSVYSGNTYQAAIYLGPTLLARLPAAIHPHVWQKSEPYFLDVNRWAYAELRVPVYPEPRVYRQVARQICKYAGGERISLWIKQKPHPITGAFGSEYYDCESLN